ncbi:hypothetical protein ACFW1A_18040 [Kitasatospora sp. NPDC058965]|uniref:hypothetical protein n=1 Tax=Kitasatospora sp. NPDC058965 TaxID=3346682 RepID=UPI0036B7D629
MLPPESPVQVPGALLAETDPDTLDALLDSSRRLGHFWPLVAGTPQPGGAPSGSITVPDRTRALVEGMAEFGL